jgi:hypothetical protein
MARIKNFLTPQWLKEFEEMKRQASKNKRASTQQTSKGSSTVDHDPRATDEQAKPSLKSS